jgi:hypothetical protein
VVRVVYRFSGFNWRDVLSELEQGGKAGDDQDELGIVGVC